VLGADGKGSSWMQAIGVVDDEQIADGKEVLTFYQASEKAIAFAANKNGNDGSRHRPATVRDAIEDYKRDLIERGGDQANATRLFFHLPEWLAGRPVALLQQREVRKWRTDLIEKVEAGRLSKGSVNRIMKVFAAAMELAARGDTRIANRDAWRLPALTDAVRPRESLLTEAEVVAAVRGSYQYSDAFGLFIEVCAVTGARPIQVHRLLVCDLKDTPAGPQLMMPSSMKGKGKKKIERVARPIPVALARRLRTAAAGLSPTDKLMLDKTGKPWLINFHTDMFKRVVAAVGLGT
jgi:hypothetical protein